MPFVTIHVPQGTSEPAVRAIADGVHAAMVATIGVPPGDRFQVVHEHAPGRMFADPTYLGVARSSRPVFVQITLHAGRSDDQKRALYRAVADALAAGARVRREDVLVVLTENRSGDWCFGNGEAQVLDSGMRPHWAAPAPAAPQ